MRRIGVSFLVCTRSERETHDRIWNIKTGKHLTNTGIPLKKEGKEKKTENTEQKIQYDRRGRNKIRRERRDEKVDRWESESKKTLDWMKQRRAMR